MADKLNIREDKNKNALLFWAIILTIFFAVALILVMLWNILTGVIG